MQVKVQPEGGRETKADKIKLKVSFGAELGNIHFFFMSTIVKTLKENINVLLNGSCVMVLCFPPHRDGGLPWSDPTGADFIW